MQTIITKTNILYDDSTTLKEPERIEHDGAIYTAKLQNTFLVQNVIYAVWIIDRYLGMKDG